MKLAPSDFLHPDIMSCVLDVSLKGTVFDKVAWVNNIEETLNHQNRKCIFAFNLKLKY